MKFWNPLTRHALAFLALCASAQSAEFFDLSIPGTAAEQEQRLQQKERSRKKSDPLAESRPLITDAPVRDEEYVLGPGDVLNVSFGRLPQVEIGPDGTVAFPGFPPMHLSGQTLAAARAKIKRLVAKSYDTASIFVTLSEPNRFRAWIVGEVNAPGAKDVNSYTRLTDIIELAEGFTPFAARARVRLLRDGNAGSLVDVSAYFRDLKPADNPILHFGDRVIVERVDFKKPYCVIRHDGHTHYHQLEGDLPLSEIYRQIAGFSASPSPAYVAVISAGGATTLIPPERTFDYFPKQGDTVEFASKKETVYVGGSVSKPGSYEYVPGLYAVDYAFLAGMNSESSTKSSLFVTRGKSVYTEKQFGNRILLPGDKVFVDRRKLYVARDYVTVISSLAGIVISAATLYVVASSQ
jgi:protein involved in polysaccharide export with SLBB domain